MARNRMIKPEFWASETLMRVSRDARLTFIGVWNFCDDYGFILNAPRTLLGDIYPYDTTVTEQKLMSWINELINEKLLIPIKYKGKSLFFVKGWGEHQTVQHKSKRSFVEIDDLEEVIKESLKSHESLIEVYLESHAPKKKEKEKEKEKVKDFTPPSFEELKVYCDSLEYNLDPKKIYEYYNINNWHDGKGNKVLNWKQKILSVWCKEENKTDLFNQSIDDFEKRMDQKIYGGNNG